MSHSYYFSWLSKPSSPAMQMPSWRWYPKGTRSFVLRLCGRVSPGIVILRCEISADGGIFAFYFSSQAADAFSTVFPCFTVSCASVIWSVDNHNRHEFRVKACSPDAAATKRFWSKFDHQIFKFPRWHILPSFPAHLLGNNIYRLNI